MGSVRCPVDVFIAGTLPDDSRLRFPILARTIALDSPCGNTNGPVRSSPRNGTAQSPNRPSATSAVPIITIRPPLLCPASRSQSCLDLVSDLGHASSCSTINSVPHADSTKILGWHGQPRLRYGSPQPLHQLPHRRLYHSALPLEPLGRERHCGLHEAPQASYRRSTLASG